MRPDAALIFVAVVFLVILAVLWFFLPFAIFGTKPKIDKLLEQTQRANDLLYQISVDIARLASEAAGKPSTVADITCSYCEKQFSERSAACPHCGHRRKLP